MYGLYKCANMRARERPAESADPTPVPSDDRVVHGLLFFENVHRCNS